MFVICFLSLGLFVSSSKVHQNANAFNQFNLSSLWADAIPSDHNKCPSEEYLSPSLADWDLQDYRYSSRLTPLEREKHVTDDANEIVFTPVPTKIVISRVKKTLNLLKKDHFYFNWDPSNFSKFDDKHFCPSRLYLDILLSFGLDFDLWDLFDIYELIDGFYDSGVLDFALSILKAENSIFPRYYESFKFLQPFESMGIDCFAIGKGFEWAFMSLIPYSTRFLHAFINKAMSIPRSARDNPDGTGCLSFFKRNAIRFGKWLTYNNSQPSNVKTWLAENVLNQIYNFEEMTDLFVRGDFVGHLIYSFKDCIFYCDEETMNNRLKKTNIEDLIRKEVLQSELSIPALDYSKFFHDRLDDDEECDPILEAENESQSGLDSDYVSQERGILVQENILRLVLEKIYPQ